METIMDNIAELTKEFFNDLGMEPPMATYQVEITETLRKVVTIQMPIGSSREAKDKVKEMYYNEEIVLTADDHCDTDFYIIDEE